MGANLVVDLGATCDYDVSVMMGSGASQIVGLPSDLLYADTYCNVFCAGTAGSGAIDLWIQTSPTAASGSFTDPTSGLAAFPSFISSGGRFIVNSGLWVSGIASLTAPVNNAPLFCSGGVMFGAFQRPAGHEFARIINNSGVFPSFYVAGFVSQKRTTGSGGGSTLLPGSGVVAV